MSLLMLATLLVYAVPGHAGPMPHRHTGAVHEHVVMPVSGSEAAVVVADHEHQPAPCDETGLLDDGSCCSVAHCVTMHGGILSADSTPLLPRPNGNGGLPALATPEGIGSDPALRPPSLTI
ncbi:hypothetical protein [Azospirillum sp. sgz301742]